MPVLLQVKDLHKAYGASVILDEATASFASDQKIGMIGRNGAGKSTLCRIITGEEAADSGSVIRNSALRLAYLEQHDVFEQGESVEDFLMRKTGREHWECGIMAVRFHIPNEMLSQSCHALAGGFQTRVKLTAMLLLRPNFLVMDEPSNFLDLSTLILLENFLQSFKGGTLIVSHDREFLKRTCDHTLEVDRGGLTLYPGNIEEYFEFKEIQLANKQAFNKQVEKKRTQLEAFVERFRAKASTASRAQAKIKQIARLKTIEIAHTTASVRIHIPKVEPKTGIALACEDLAIGYPDKDVARNILFDIDRGEKVAVLGDNGEGKTTFLKTIAEELPRKGGRFKWGVGLKVAYYAQHVFSALSPEDTIYSHLLRESNEGVSNQEVLRMAGCFLFKGDDVKKKVKVLSGGERARLLLAGLLLSKSHVLLLDEPTNHLDFQTVEALGRALRRFDGTVFFISHDRTFVNLIATHIVEVKKGKIRRYPGVYEDYVYSLEMDARGEAVSEPTAVPKKSSAKKIKTESEPAPEGEKEAPKPKQGVLNQEMMKIKKMMTREEKRLKHLQQDRDKICKEMQKNPFFSSKERSQRLKQIQIDIEDIEEAWYKLETKLEKLKKDNSET